MSVLSSKRRALARFSFSGRVASFQHAVRGLKTVLRTQPNLWIHLVASIAVVLTAEILQVQRWEWCILLIGIAMVWVAETINTAIEFACYAPNGSPHTHLHVAKDVAAACVLLASIASAAIGLVVLLPHFVH